MTILRWEPARELASLQSDMNRLFSAFFDPAGGADHGAARRWVPAMDVIEVDDEYVLRADLPGMSESDVAIEVEGDVLTISGERKAEHHEAGEGFVRVERGYGAFRRSLTLPDGVDPDALSARFDRGVLEVRVPKPAERKPRRVAIKVGDAPAAIEGAETSATPA